mgnify:CR=1 FL=1
MGIKRLAEPSSRNCKREMHDDHRAMCIMKPLLYLRYKDEYDTLNLRKEKKKENKGRKRQGWPRTRFFHTTHTNVTGSTMEPRLKF